MLAELVLVVVVVNVVVISVLVPIHVLVLAFVLRTRRSLLRGASVFMIIIAGPCVPMAVDEVNLLAGLQVGPRIQTACPSGLRHLRLRVLFVIT